MHLEFESRWDQWSSLSWRWDCTCLWIERDLSCVNRWICQQCEKNSLNLENENVGIGVFGSDTAIKERDIVKRTESIVDVPMGKVMLGHVIGVLAVPIDGRGALSDHKWKHVEMKGPGIIEHKSVHEPMEIGLKAVDSLVPIGHGRWELIIVGWQIGK